MEIRADTNVTRNARRREATSNKDTTNMPETLTFHRQPPGLVPLYAKALSRKKVTSGEVGLPDITAELLGVSTANKALARYESVCERSAASHLPVTWPHVLAFPLHMSLLTHSHFPLPLLGLVHLRNTITQHRAIGRGEVLDLRVRLGAQERTAKGLEFDLITEAYASGTLVWEESSVTLYRMATDEKSAGDTKSAPPELDRYPHTLTINAPEPTGRRYAEVSGDRNPIHMHALSARLFGFPRAIAHGMWTKARSLAELEQQGSWRSGPMRVSCQFKKPLLLPGTAQLNWQTGETGWDFQVLTAKGDAPHLSGRIDWL